MGPRSHYRISAGHQAPLCEWLSEFAAGAGGARLAMSESTRDSSGSGPARRAPRVPSGAAQRHAAKRGSPLARHRRAGKHADEGHELSVREGSPRSASMRSRASPTDPRPWSWCSSRRDRVRCASRSR